MYGFVAILDQGVSCHRAHCSVVIANACKLAGRGRGEEARGAPGKGAAKQPLPLSPARSDPPRQVALTTSHIREIPAAASFGKQRLGFPYVTTSSAQPMLDPAERPRATTLEPKWLRKPTNHPCVALAVESLPEAAHRGEAAPGGCPRCAVYLVMAMAIHTRHLFSGRSAVIQIKIFHRRGAFCGFRA